MAKKKNKRRNTSSKGKPASKKQTAPQSKSTNTNKNKQTTPQNKTANANKHNTKNGKSNANRSKQPGKQQNSTTTKSTTNTNVKPTSQNKNTNANNNKSKPISKPKPSAEKLSIITRLLMVLGLVSDKKKTENNKPQQSTTQNKSNNTNSQNNKRKQKPKKEDMEYFPKHKRHFRGHKDKTGDKIIYHPNYVVGEKDDYYISFGVTSEKKYDKKHNNQPLDKNPNKNINKPAYIHRDPTIDTKDKYSHPYTNYHMSEKDDSYIDEKIEKFKK